MQLFLHYFINYEIFKLTINVRSGYFHPFPLALLYNVNPTVPFFFENI